VQVRGWISIERVNWPPRGSLEVSWGCRSTWSGPVEGGWEESEEFRLGPCPEGGDPLLEDTDQAEDGRRNVTGCLGPEVIRLTAPGVIDPSRGRKPLPAVNGR